MNTIEIYPMLTDEHKELLTSRLADLANIEHTDQVLPAQPGTTADK